MSMILSVFLLQAAAAASPAVTTAAIDPEENKTVCKTVTPTGSRLGGKRVCMTKKEWKRLSEENEKGLRGVQDSFSKQTPDG